MFSLNSIVFLTYSFFLFFVSSFLLHWNMRCKRQKMWGKVPQLTFEINGSIVYGVLADYSNDWTDMFCRRHRERIILGLEKRKQISRLVNHFQRHFRNHLSFQHALQTKTIHQMAEISWGIQDPKRGRSTNAVGNMDTEKAMISKTRVWGVWSFDASTRAMWIYLQ